MRSRTKPKKVDYFFVSLIFLLTAFGLVMLTSASSDLGKMKFNDSYYHLKHQLIYGLSLGLAGFFIAANVYYRRWEKLALFFLIASIGLLGLVLLLWEFYQAAPDAGLLWDNSLFNHPK